MNLSQRERRKYPRTIAKIPLKIRHQQQEIVTATHDISCIGVYCTIEQYIEPFCRLSIVLSLPGSKSFIQCQGIVVRTEKNEEVVNHRKSYSIAIFFNEMKPRDRAKLMRYVQSQIYPCEPR
ncbi:MAG: PilZ domain-containing protein [Candidatus Omnitrophica bacterium]|nr:PilZ domain-containing protein [Candidatus Omnitrophota bacterium]